jgi:outer membrane protein assembly factor BamB
VKKAAFVFGIFILVAIPVLVVLRSRNRIAAPPPIPTPIKKWEFVTGEADRHPGYSPFYSPQHTPAIAEDGTIYVGGSAGVYALNPDGSLKWVYKQTCPAVTSPVVDDTGVIWADCTTFTASFKNGAISKIQPDGSGTSLIGIAPVTQIGVGFDGTIYMGTTVHMLALNPDPTSKQFPKWTVAGTGLALTADDQLYVTSETNPLMLLSVDGSLKWRLPDRRAECSPPALGLDGTVFLGCDGLLVYNPDGSGKSAFPAEGRLGSPSIAEDGTIYFGSEDKHVYALAPDGHLRWKFATQGEVFSTPAIARNGTIYFGSFDSKLYAVGPDGKMKWAFTTGGPVFSPTIAPDGTIYAQSTDGKLYAIKDTEDNGGLWGQWPKLGAGLRNTARGAR